MTLIEISVTIVVEAVGLQHEMHCTTISGFSKLSTLAVVNPEQLISVSLPILLGVSDSTLNLVGKCFFPYFSEQSETTILLMQQQLDLTW